MAAQLDYTQKLKGFFSKLFFVYMKTCAIHVNIIGPRFKEVRELSGKQFEDLFEAIDVIAGRIHALGESTPLLSLQGVLDTSEIKETSILSGKMDLESAIHELIDTHHLISGEAMKLAGFCEDMRDDLTADLIRVRASEHEKAASALNCVLQQ